jgi:two-component system copper resistance phosphate regulon response regulator CusR
LVELYPEVSIMSHILDTKNGSPTMRILLVEDENKAASYLSGGLSENGFQVDVSREGRDGLFKALTQHYDLIILDVGLPGIDGWGIIAGIRQVNQAVRVLFLTARDTVEDKVKGLQLGADDYLVKPFAFSELLARVRALLRRKTQLEPTTLTLADMQIDLIKHKVKRGTKTVTLTPKEFSLLVFLTQHAGEVISRTLISERVWDINFDCDTNVVDVAIRRLRQKVDDDFPIKLIHTVRGIGYVVEER